MTLDASPSVRTAGDSTAAPATRGTGARALIDPLLSRRSVGALDAPLLIGVGAVVRPDHPVPESEQLLSAGAAAMNLLNALHLLGYGGMWVTGADCYDPVVNAALGFQSPDRLIGFIHAGTPKGQEPAAPRPARSDHVVDWAGVDWAGLDRTGRETAP